MLMTVVAIMVVSLSVSAHLALAVPDEQKAAFKDLCKQINRFGAVVVAVNPQTGEPFVDPATGEFSVFTDQGECIEYVNAGGEIFPIAAP
jgi:hypothetical protein